MLKIAAFLVVCLTLISCAASEDKKPTKEERMEMMKAMVKKMCAADPAKQKAWEKCCIVNKHLGDEIAEACKTEAFGAAAEDRIKNTCKEGVMKPPSTEQRDKLIKCAEGKDKDKAAALQAFDTKPFSEKVETFKAIMACKNSAL